MAYGYIYITKKQEEILMLIYKFRFLDRIQIQTLMNHKDARRINAWLKDLVEKKFLGRIYARKIPENIKPAIYYAGINGIHFFERHRQCNKTILSRLKKEPYHSERFRNRCLFLAELYLQLLNSHDQGYVLKNFDTKTSLADYENMLIPFPDAMIIRTKQIEKQQRKTNYFLEVIDLGTPRYYLRHRIKQYIEYFEEEHFDKGKFPKILLICPNKLTHQFLEKFIQKSLEDSNIAKGLSFHLAEKEDISTKGLTGEIWTNIS